MKRWAAVFVVACLAAATASGVNTLYVGNGVGEYTNIASAWTVARTNTQSVGWDIILNGDQAGVTSYNISNCAVCNLAWTVPRSPARPVRIIVPVAKRAKSATDKLPLVYSRTGVNAQSVFFFNATVSNVTVAGLTIIHTGGNNVANKAVSGPTRAYTFDSCRFYTSWSSAIALDGIVSISPGSVSHASDTDAIIFRNCIFGVSPGADDKYTAASAIAMIGSSVVGRTNYLQLINCTFAATYGGKQYGNIIRSTLYATGATLMLRAYNNIFSEPKTNGYSRWFYTGGVATNLIVTAAGNIGSSRIRGYITSVGTASNTSVSSAAEVLRSATNYWHPKCQAVETGDPTWAATNDFLGNTRSRWGLVPDVGAVERLTTFCD